VHRAVDHLHAAQVQDRGRGYALPGTELRIAEDGEVCMRGPHVFKGYFANEEATAETLTEDGWLLSGDIGVIDDDGFLKITDRKKELIITAGGKNIAPTLIEGTIKSVPAIGQAVVIGDRRKFLSALIALDPERLETTLQEMGLPAGTSMEDASNDEKVQKYVLDAVTEVLTGFSRVEQVRKVTVLPRELAEENGELTPTMKLKRKIITENWADQIEAMYQG